MKNRVLILGALLFLLGYACGPKDPEPERHTSTSHKVTPVAKETQSPATETMVRMITIAVALENRATDLGWYPATEEIVDQNSAFRKTYTDAGFPLLDAWGNPIVIRTRVSGRNTMYGNRPDQYVIESGGADGIIRLDATTSRRANNALNEDLILDSGKWIRWWNAPRPKSLNQALAPWWPEHIPATSVSPKQ